jgi:hypothetical protein
MSSSPPVTQALLAWADYWYPISWKCLLIAGAITAIGGCVTIAFLILQLRTISIRETQTEWRRSVLERDVDEVRKIAADELARYTALKEEASDEQANVAFLNMKAADLNMQNKYVAQVIEPRKLSAAQIHDLIQAWKGYSGRSVILWSYAADFEGSALSEQIKSALIGARVVVINDIGRLTPSAPQHIGIEGIEVAGVDKRLVAAIHAGLHEIGGLEAAEIELPDGDEVYKVPAEIFVGTKAMTKKN